MNLRAQGPAMLPAARAMSLEANVAAVAVGAVTAARVGGCWWCAALGGLLLALHPLSITGTTVARAYGLLTLGMALHVLALVVWAERPGGRRAWAVALTALPLPWIHYSAVPWLLLLGVGAALTVPALRRLPLLYAPAAAGFLPLALRILSIPDRREIPTRGVLETLDLVLGLGMHTRRLPTLGPLSWTALTVLAVLAAVALAGGRTPPRLRVAAWAAAAVPAGAAALNTVQLVRPVTSVVMVTAAAPLLAGVAGALPRGWQRAVVGLGLAGALAWPLHVTGRVAARPDVHREAVREVAALVDAGAFPGDGPVIVEPRGLAPVLFYYLTGEHVSRARKDGPCEPHEGCMALRGRAWLPRDVVDPREARWILSFERRPPSPPGCRPVEAPEGARLLRCDPPEPAADASSP